MKGCKIQTGARHICPFLTCHAYTGSREELVWNLSSVSYACRKRQLNMDGPSLSLGIADVPQ